MRESSFTPLDSIDQLPRLPSLPQYWVVEHPASIDEIERQDEEAIVSLRKKRVWLLSIVIAANWVAFLVWFGSPGMVLRWLRTWTTIFAL